MAETSPKRFQFIPGGSVAEIYPQRFKQYSGCQVSERGLSRYAIPTQAGVAQEVLHVGAGLFPYYYA